jgi:SAM-dependent methyltransferase
VPLPDASCDLAVLFLSWHHVADNPRGAAELARVLRPGGAMFVRGTFGDRVPDLSWHRFFPEARAVEERIFPRLDDTVDLFAAAGLEEAACRRVELRRVESMAAWAERLRTRSISTFEHMSPDQIEVGFARLGHAVAEHERDVEFVDGADLLVLRRRVGGPLPGALPGGRNAICGDRAQRERSSMMRRILPMERSMVSGSWTRVAALTPMVFLISADS